MNKGGRGRNTLDLHYDHYLVQYYPPNEHYRGIYWLSRPHGPKNSSLLNSIHFFSVVGLILLLQSQGNTENISAYQVLFNLVRKLINFRNEYA